MNDKLYKFNKTTFLLFCLLISSFFIYSESKTDNSKLKYNNYEISSDTIIIKKIIEYDTNFVNKIITVRIKEKKIYYEDYETLESETQKIVMMEKIIPITDFDKMMRKYGIEKTIEKIQQKINKTLNKQNEILSKIKLSVNLPTIYFGTTSNKFITDEKDIESIYNYAINSSFDFAVKSSVETEISSWVIELGLGYNQSQIKITNDNKLNPMYDFSINTMLEFDTTEKYYKIIDGNVVWFFVVDTIFNNIIDSSFAHKVIELNNKSLSFFTSIG